ncbi:hypothetical protein B0H14DRAFT_2643503 [Mycena olivaceomarginata]|nr:hypothetical protein B0H14DRAFT_2643503 [Mycena olivaceomarginata]
MCRENRYVSQFYGAAHLVTATFVQWLCSGQIGSGNFLNFDGRYMAGKHYSRPCFFITRRVLYTRIPTKLSWAAAQKFHHIWLLQQPVHAVQDIPYRPYHPSRRQQPLCYQKPWAEITTRGNRFRGPDLFRASLNLNCPILNLFLMTARTSALGTAGSTTPCRTRRRTGSPQRIQMMRGADSDSDLSELEGPDLVESLKNQLEQEIAALSHATPYERIKAPISSTHWKKAESNRGLGYTGNSDRNQTPKAERCA